MASGTFVFHASAFAKAWNKEMDINGGTVKAMLSNSTYVPNVDTHDYKDDVTNEVTGTNWAAGGVTVANPVVTVTGASNRVSFGCDDISVATVTLTGGRVLTLYDNIGGGTDASRPIIGSITYDSDLSPNAGTLLFDFDGTNGLGYVTY